MSLRCYFNSLCHQAHMINCPTFRREKTNPKVSSRVFAEARRWRQEIVEKERRGSSHVQWEPISGIFLLWPLLSSTAMSCSMPTLSATPWVTLLVAVTCLSAPPKSLFVMFCSSVTTALQFPQDRFSVSPSVPQWAVWQPRDSNGC